MAYDPNKRRNNEGTQVGHIRLLPSSVLDNLAKSVAGFKDRYNSVHIVDHGAQFNQRRRRTRTGWFHPCRRPPRGGDVDTESGCNAQQNCVRSSVVCRGAWQCGRAAAAGRHGHHAFGRADLTSTAGNQSVALKNANLDVQSRINAVALQNQGENDCAVVDARAANEAVARGEAGKTERERLKLEKPEHLIEFDGSLLSVSDAAAVPVLNGNTPVRLERPGAITPAIALESIQNELAASQQSLTPDPERVGALQRQVDVLRRPNAGPLPGDGVDGFRFRGGNPRLAANWQRLLGGEP